MYFLIKSIASCCRQIAEEQAKETATSVNVEVLSTNEQETKTMVVEKQADAKDLLRLTMEAFQIPVGYLMALYRHSFI